MFKNEAKKNAVVYKPPKERIAARVPNASNNGAFFVAVTRTPKKFLAELEESLGYGRGKSFRSAFRYVVFAHDSSGESGIGFDPYPNDLMGYVSDPAIDNERNLNLFIPFIGETRS